MKGINRGGLTLPTKTWLRDYKSMEHLFFSYHPKNSLLPGRGLIKNLFFLLKEKFPDYRLCHFEKDNF